MDFQDIINHLNREVGDPLLISAITIEVKSGIYDRKSKKSVVVHTPYQIIFSDEESQEGISPETLSFIDVAVFSALEQEDKLQYVDDIVIRSTPCI